MNLNRKDFILSGGAFAASFIGNAAANDGDAVRFGPIQREIDAVTPAAFGKYLGSGDTQEAPALVRLESALDKVIAEVKAADASQHPAVWLLYNMGIVVKTASCCFSIDVMHRRGQELAPLLDFAMITHNHLDHYTQAFYRAMDGAGKTVFSSFLDNYGAHRGKDGLGGFTRRERTYDVRGVRIRTDFTDHNKYLEDFTTTFEISVGKWRLFHSGDCSNVGKLKPSRSPDLWFVHPRCGMDVVDGVRKFKPKLTAIAHLAELGHGKWRWTLQDGLAERDRVLAAGGKATVPMWGDRVC